MSRINIDVKKLKKAMYKKGFDIKDEGKHIKVRFIYNGKKTRICTVFSHSHSDIGSKLVNEISKQLNITKEELKQIQDCPLTEEKLIAIYKDKNIIK